MEKAHKIELNKNLFNKNKKEICPLSLTIRTNIADTSPLKLIFSYTHFVRTIYFKKRFSSHKIPMRNKNPNSTFTFEIRVLRVCEFEIISFFQFLKYK